MFAYVGVTFSAVADITTDTTPKQRARVFGLVESSLWAGMTVGPYVIGNLIFMYGLPSSFWFTVAAFAVTLLIILVFFEETNLPAVSASRSCQSLPWKLANPFGSIAFISGSQLSGKGKRNAALL